jgi:uncharacterized protein (TIGR00251 family)
VGDVELDLRTADGGVTLRLRVQPRASRDQLGGVRDGALVVRVTAPPVNGSANDAVVRLLARRLSRPPSSITIVRGGTGRDKTVHLAGLDAASARALLTEAK